MQVQSSGTGPASGYSAVQSGGRRPAETRCGAGRSAGRWRSGQRRRQYGGNQPVQDPNATRGRIVNITA